MKMNREIKNLIEKIKHIKLSKKEKVFLRSKIENLFPGIQYEKSSTTCQKLENFQSLLLEP